MHIQGNFSLILATRFDCKSVAFPTSLLLLVFSFSVISDYANAWKKHAT